MMTICRPFLRAELRGFHVLQLKAWVPQAETMLLGCFQAFDNALHAIRHDPDATRIIVPGFKSENSLTLLNTAAAAALRSLPEIHAPGARLFSCAVSIGEKKLWSNLPPWCRLWLERRDGSWDELTVAKRESAWNEMHLEADQDERLHLSFFGTQPLSAVGLSTGRVFRTASLIHQDPARAVSFSLEIGAR